MKIEFDIIENSQLEESHSSLFSEMLKKQRKVQGNFSEKANRCKFICIAKINGNAAAVGAIKEKTSSDFCTTKSNLPELGENFEWELGYFYTDDEYKGIGLASFIARTLIQNFGDGNLMASTEVSANPGMVKILESNGFRLYGNPWKSAIHNNYLGLFLKFK